MEANRTCRACGVVVAKDAPFGHCPRCLLELGFLAAEAPRQTQKSKAAHLKFGDYELLEQIGRGGMGVVYKARQISLNRTVALKMVLDSHLASPVVLRRFLIEAEAAAKLEHANIVPIYEVAEVEGQHFFSMRLIEGESLEEKIALGEYDVGQRGRTRFKTSRDKTQEKIATLMATVARAVHYAHERGVLHRDLKPSNILIDKHGQPHLTDFGLAKINDANLEITPRTAVLGTPGYMAPEQASAAECTAAADIYSLGAIFYELLVGKPPFEGATPLEILRKTTQEDPLHPSQSSRGIDRDLATICLKCLEKPPSGRYATAENLAADLDRWLRHEPILARPASMWLRSRRWTERNRAGTAVIASLFAGLVITSISLRHAHEQRRAKEAALASFTRAISRQIDHLGSTNSYYEITSEQFAYLDGRQPDKPRGALKRYRVGVFIFSGPLPTVLGYGRLFSELEQIIAKEFKQEVKLDFRIYIDHGQAGEHLAAGRIDFLRADPRLAMTLHDKHNVQLLAQDQAKADVAVIFARSGTDITNLAQLKGHSLVMFDRHSTVTLTAKELLATNGFCETDFSYRNLNGVAESVAPQPNYFESPEQGYFDRQCETIRQVLDLKRYDAGVARERQFRLKATNQWHTLARFEFIRHVWIVSPKLGAEAAQVFQQALFHRKWGEHPSDLLDSYGPGYESGIVSVPSGFISRMKRAVIAEQAFDNCTGRDGAVDSEDISKSTSSKPITPL